MICMSHGHERGCELGLLLDYGEQGPSHVAIFCVSVCVDYARAKTTTSENVIASGHKWPLIQITLVHEQSLAEY